mgnify:CR=1 FL=1
MLDSFLEVGENKQLLIAIVVRFIIQLLLKIEVMKLLSIHLSIVTLLYSTPLGVK